MRVLFVDDDAGVIDFYTQVARAKGYEEADVARSGEEALTLVIRQPYDLITLDIQMPGASGLEILSLLRSLSPHAVIAIVSGYIPDDPTGQTAACADVLIDKPVTVDTLSRLFDGASKVGQAMEAIRQLGRVPSAPR